MYFVEGGQQNREAFEAQVKKKQKKKKKAKDKSQKKLSDFWGTPKKKRA